MFTLIEHTNLDTIWTRRSSFAALFIFLLGQFQSGDAVATNLYYDVGRELDRLPALCKYKTAENMRTVHRKDTYGTSEEQMGNEWGYRQYGNVWWHMHHYCWGLIDSLRAAEAIGKGGQGGEKSALRMSIDNFMYVINNARKPHTKEYTKLEAQLYYRIGRAHERLGEQADAAAAYSMAIRRKPTYEEAYAALSDLFRGLGQDGEARKVLRDGLEQVPKSSKLERRMAELSSKAEVE